MGFLPLRLDDVSWLYIWQMIYVVALTVTVLATVLVNIFNDRVTKKMQGEIATSNETAAQSNAVAAKANERAEELKAENLKLGIKLEEERQARLEIERRLADRFVSSKEETIIADAIRPYAGHRIFVLKGDGTEPNKYATQLFDVFRKYKWDVIPSDEGLLSPAPTGILIRTSTKPDSAVQALIAGLKKARIQPKVIPYEHLSPDYVLLVVGVKPPP